MTQRPSPLYQALFPRLFPAAIAALLIAIASPAFAEDAPGLHAGWDSLLKAHVSGDDVDYAGFQRDEAKLDRYLRALADTDPSRLPKQEQLALYINAYNAFTVKLILSRYPDIESIKDIPGRWDREEWTIGGEKLSLGQIEHEILRKRFTEPRIHFAIVCASKSCPSLRAEAYVASRLSAQLTEAATVFLADTSKGLKTKSESGSLWGKNHYIYTSKIFSWFDDDFEAYSGTVLDYIAPYAPQSARTFIRKHQGDAKLRTFDYDWSLNDK